MGLNAVIAIALFLIILYWYLIKHYDYWKKRNIVSLPAYPIVGSHFASYTLKKHVSLTYADQYNQYPNEKVIGGFNGRHPDLIIRDPDIIKTVLIKDFNYFVDRAFKTDDEKELLANHLFRAKEDLWRTLRYRLTPTFTSGKIRKMFPLIAECGEELQNYAKEMADSGKEVEVRDMLVKFTIDVIGSCAFGIKMQSMKEESTLFTEMSKKIFGSSIWHGLKTTLNTTSPRLFYALKLRIFSKEVEDFFVNLFKTIIKNRENEQPRHDFIDLLREIKANKSLPVDRVKNPNIKDIELTYELLAAQSFVFFAAGFETSSTTMSYCLHELAFNPDIQNRLIKEIDSVLLKHNGEITYEAIHEMRYLDMVVSETLRKHPPIAWVDRVSNSNYNFPNIDLKIDKGIEIIIPIYGLHHDAKYYPDPEKFDPERFNSENISKRHPQVFLPFGDGPRNCIGARFAKVQTAYGLISILKSYSVEPTSNTQRIIGYKRAGVILSCNHEIWLRLIARK